MLEMLQWVMDKFMEIEVSHVPRKDKEKVAARLKLI